MLNTRVLSATKTGSLFFEGPVQGLATGDKFDLIVCAIPFLNLPVQITQDIFRKFAELSHSQTSITYYEYMWLRQLGKALSPERRKRLGELENFISTLHEENLCSVKKIWLNVLPINVYRVDGLAA